MKSLLAWGTYYQHPHSTFLSLLFHFVFPKNKIHKSSQSVGNKIKTYAMNTSIEHIDVSIHACLSTEMIFTENKRRVFAIHMVQRQRGLPYELL